MLRAFLPFFSVIACAIMGCPAREAFCAEEVVVQCVESCDTPAFRQCFECPTGSFDQSLCAAAPTTCDASHMRPAGSCDDATCTDGANGRCLLDGATEVCVYDACTSAGDCAVGERCACDGGPLGAHVCVAATCDGPEDCGGLPCLPVAECDDPDDADRGGTRAYRCATPDDACRDDADCPTGTLCTTAGEAFACADPAC